MAGNLHLTFRKMERYLSVKGYNKLYPLEVDGRGGEMTHFTGKLRKGNILTMVLMFSYIMAAYPGLAEAVSVGPYVDLAGGAGTFEWETSTAEFDVDTNSAAVGFALDTSPLGKKNFSYRLNVGFEGQELEDDYGVILDLGGIYMENVFCFTFLKKTNFRWWGGPLVRFGFYSGETETYYYLGDRYRDEHDYFQFGLGFATGVNIKVGGNVVLAPSTGVRFMGAGGTAEIINLDKNFSYQEDISGGFTNVFVNFALLF